MTEDLVPGPAGEGVGSRVEWIVHEAMAELSAQGHVYLDRLGERLSPGLGRDAVEVLLRLHRTGAQSVQGLAEQLHLSPATVSARVDTLEAHALVVRRTHPREPRVQLLDVAERALEPLELAEAERRGRMLDALMDWPADERQLFARMLSRFADRDDLAAEASSMLAARPARRPIW